MDSIAYFAIAVLSGLGVGSGGLLVIYLTLIKDIPQLSAQGVNLVFFILASLSSLIFSFTKRHIPTGAVLIMSLFGIIGSLVGTWLASVLPPEILKKIFGVMLVGSGILALSKR